MAQIYVSDGKISGGKGGAIIIGIIAAIITSILYFIAPSDDFNFTTGAKIIHLFMSALNIPIAIAGQKVAVFIDRLRHEAAGNHTSIEVSSELSTLVIKRFLGALIGILIFEVAFFVIADGAGKAAQQKVYLQQIQEIATEERAIQQEEKLEKEKVIENTNAERDEFIKKYLGELEFVTIETDKVTGYLSRNGNKLPKNIKFIGNFDHIYNSLYQWTGDEILDLSESFVGGVLPDVKAIVNINVSDYSINRNYNKVYNNIEVIVQKNGESEIGINIPENFPKLRALFIPASVVELNITFSSKADTVFASGMKVKKIRFGNYVSEDLSITESVTAISVGKSPNLKTLNIPPNSKLISLSCTETSVESLFIPVTVEGIYLPKTIKTITFASNAPPKYIRSDSIPKTIEKIYVPAGSLKRYTDEWYNYEFTFNNQLQPIQ